MVMRLSPLLPREAGAIVQLAIALATGLMLVPKTPAFLQAGAILLAFLVATPARLWLAERSHRSLGWLSIAGLGLALLLQGQVFRSTEPLWPALLPALAGATLLGSLYLRHREHGPLGEHLAAWTFATTSLPVLRAGGMAWCPALEVSAGLLGLFALGTWSVRAQRQKPILRLLPVLAGITWMALACLGHSPLSLRLAPLPLTLLAGLLALKPESSFRRLGWKLALATLLGAWGLAMAF